MGVDVVEGVCQSWILREALCFATEVEGEERKHQMMSVMYLVRVLAGQAGWRSDSSLNDMLQWIVL